VWPTPAGHVLHPQSETLTPIQSEVQIAVVKGAMPVVCHVWLTRVTACRTKRSGFGLLASILDIKGRRQWAGRTCLQSDAHIGKGKGCVYLLHTVWNDPGTHPAFVPWTPSRGAQIFPKSSRHFKILAARNVTYSKVRTGDPEILGAIVATGTYCWLLPGIVPRSRMSGAIPHVPIRFHIVRRHFYIYWSILVITLWTVIRTCWTGKETDLKVSAYAGKRRHRQTKC